MRRISLILAVIFLATSALARVDITCVIDDNEVTISYNVVDEPNKVRAFALDVEVTGANIVDVNDSISAHYYIYPGSIEIDGDGEVTAWGSPIADANDPGSITGPNSATLEMGALYSPTSDSSPNAPPLFGDLLKIICDAKPSAVAISENETRGGVVLTDPNEDPDVNSPGCSGGPDCLIGGNADQDPGSEYQAWSDWGKPNCWCYARQCRGDADGKQQYATYWVLTNDLDILAAAFAKDDPTLATITVHGEPGVCADFDHKKQYATYRVLTDDLTILAAYFAKNNPHPPMCDASPIITGPYNFWIVP
jgi:hypothetical protein